MKQRKWLQKSVLLALPLLTFIIVHFIKAFAQPRENIPGFLILWYTFFLIWGLLIFYLNQTKLKNAANRLYFTWFILLFLCGLIARLLLLPNEPELSDDVWRYAWDGKVLANGINPYLYPPNALELEKLKTDWSHRITYPEVRTVYPPVGVLVLRVGAFLADGYLGQKLLFFLGELLGIGLLLAVLIKTKLREMSIDLLVLYWFNPLMIFLSGSEAHLDIFLVLFFAFIAALKLSSKFHRSFIQIITTVLVTLAVLVKPYFVVVYAIFLHRRRWAYPVLMAPLVVLMFLFPYMKDIWKLLEQPLLYANHWQFNSPFYNLAGTVVSNEPARLLCYMAAIISAILIALKCRGKLAWLLSIPLLFLPTVYPWYLVPALMFAAIEKNMFLIFLSTTLPLSYLSWHFNEWQLPGWVLWLEYGLPVLLYMGFRYFFRQKEEAACN